MNDDRDAIVGAVLVYGPAALEVLERHKFLIVELGSAPHEHVLEAAREIERVQRENVRWRGRPYKPWDVTDVAELLLAADVLGPIVDPAAIERMLEHAAPLEDLETLVASA